MLFPDNKVLLGVAPTRRDDAYFPADIAVRQKIPVINKLKEMGIDFVDLEGTCEDGLLAKLDDVDAAAKIFTEKGIDALFVPSVVFGSESAVALLAKKLNVPLLIWSPADPDGTGRTGRPQLGTLTIGKVLRRVKVPYTFLGSCGVDHPLFEKGLRTFIAAANVVKQFKGARIIQLGQRPESFWSVIANEGELLERFGIPIYQVPLLELFEEYDAVQDSERVKTITKELLDRTTLCVDSIIAEKSAKMMIALENMAEKRHATAIAIQCWDDIAKHIGIWPCAAASLLNEKGLVVACEGDVHGAISCIIAQAASMGKALPILVDYDGGHFEDVNVMNVHHCAAAPICCYDEKPRLWRRPPPPGKNWGGCISGQFPPHGKMSFLRFDGDNGNYSVLLARGEGVDGPMLEGERSYGWYKVEDWPKLEYKLTTGCYIHHGVVIYDDILPAVHEALRFIEGVEPDYAFDSERIEMESFMYKRERP